MCKNHSWKIGKKPLIASTNIGSVVYGHREEKVCENCNHVFDYDLEDDKYGIPRPQLRQFRRIEN